MSEVASFNITTIKIAYIPKLKRESAISEAFEHQVLCSTRPHQLLYSLNEKVYTSHTHS